MATLRMNPAATFDVLAIHGHLRRSIGATSRSELHLFAYLGCLLSLYDRRPASEWRYSFVATQFGAPFSADLDDAFREALLDGVIAADANPELSQLTAEGDEELADLSTLLTLKARDRHLEAACATSLMLPISMTREAVVSDSRIRSSLALQTTRALLTSDWYADIHSQFDALRSAVGDASIDLLAPAVVWVRYFGERKSA
jgi:hypothetical protein